MDTILDLHGTKHIDVFRKIDNFLYEHLEKADEYNVKHQTNLLNDGQIDLLLT